MKKSIIMLAVLFAVNTGTFAQTSRDSVTTHKKTTYSSVKYTCPMHKEVVMNKPGNCPKCGAKLVAMKAKKTTIKKTEMKM
jgi:transcription initiation factor IIE alpha subunit